ncbi:MAG: hypothetical protein AAFV53_33180, partial [Myxococcota bacterium]
CYRLSASGVVQVTASLSQPVKDSRIGPQGAALAMTSRGLVGVAPGCPPVHIEGMSLEGAKFSPHGRCALLQNEAGTALVDLKTGGRLSEIIEDTVPVGFAHTPIVLREMTGEVINIEGETLSNGWLPGVTLRSGNHLFGPTGAWNLQTGQLLWQHPALSAERLELDGDHLSAILPEDVFILDVRTGSVVDARPREAIDAEDDEREEDEPEEAVIVDIPGFDVTDCAEVDERCWVWNDNGLLAVLRLSPERLSPERLSPERLSPERLSPERLSPERPR